MRYRTFNWSTCAIAPKQSLTVQRIPQAPLAGASHLKRAITSKHQFFTFYYPHLWKSSTNVIMSELYKQREIWMKKALDAFFKNSYKSAAVCAWEFDVEPRLFQQRLRFGEKFKFTRAVITRLSDHQELALREYIEFLDSNRNFS
jgi:hypothetical protein